MVRGRGLPARAGRKLRRRGCLTSRDEGVHAGISRRVIDRGQCGGRVPLSLAFCRRVFRPRRAGKCLLVADGLPALADALPPLCIGIRQLFCRAKNFCFATVESALVDMGKLILNSLTGRREFGSPEYPGVKRIDVMTIETATEPEKKRRRTKGEGSVYRQGRFWWIQYQHPDGTRRRESTKSERRPVALRMLRDRLSRGALNLPVIARAEQLTFHDAAQAVIDDFVANKKKSEDVVRRRIRLHLMPYFGGRRMVGITTADVTAYIAKRQTDTIVTHTATATKPANRKSPAKAATSETRKPVSAGEINRELQILKRIFSLAIESGRLASKPAFKMLREAPARAGFFEPDQYGSVLAHLPVEIQPVITFAYMTGWRIASEVLPLEWRQVDFDAGEVRLDAGTTKNGEGRVFPMTTELRRMLKVQEAQRDQFKNAGIIMPRVFWRMVADERGGDKKPRPIVSLNGAWKAACLAAGLPGRIPHDLRRTAVRNLVRAGVPQSVAMKLTGHKTDSVFRRYDIVSPDDLRVAVERLDALNLHVADLRRQRC